MASLPVIDDSKYGEVWGKAEDSEEDDHKKSAKFILMMNVWLNIGSIVINCLAFAFSRQSYLRRTIFGLIYCVLYLLVLILLGLWIGINPNKLESESS